VRRRPSPRLRSPILAFSRAATVGTMKHARKALPTRLQTAVSALRYMPVTSIVYACGTVDTEGMMARQEKLKRASFFIDVRALRRARLALGAPSDAETVRMSVERVAEMERFWRFMRKSRRKLSPGSIEP
jgi:hypothetical protein